jgi:hypothetical protein
MQASIMYKLSGSLKMNPRTTSIGQRSKATQSDRRPITTPGVSAAIWAPIWNQINKEEKHRAPVKIPIRSDHIRGCHLPMAGG